MVYFLDSSVNLLLNFAGFTGLGDPHQILIAVVLGSAAVLWNSSLVPKWALSAFFAIMTLASFVAIYALFLGRQPACVYAYDPQKAVIGDSLERRLTWQDIRDFDCPTLWVARNELFYRSNYCFFTPIAYSYFGNQETCDPAVEKPNTEIGDNNAHIIARLETRKGCLVPLESCIRLRQVSSSKLDLDRQTVKDAK